MPSTRIVPHARETPYIPTAPTAEDVFNVNKHTKARDCERTREAHRWRKGDRADYVFKLSGGHQQRVPCVVLEAYERSVLVRLSRDVSGYGTKREIKAALDRLERSRA